MCGISGLCLADPAGAVPPGLLDAMNRSLAHRGPDGAGTYVMGPVGLAHRRLSIIDLATGDQPMFNEDRTVALVFNGEIYNYRELQVDLAARGHRLSTASDTEVIVHLYEDRGDDCLDDLNGMFAFALWDARRRRLLLARDRLGERPLYYSERPGRLVFASEMKAILRDPDLPRDVDRDALDEYLAYGYVPAPRTIFQAIRKLRAGERLVYENGRVDVSRYWTVPFAERQGRDESSYVEELTALLEDSVRLRLRSDVPVGAFLSGGIDSASVVSFAAPQVARLQTFSVGFEEADHDELALARLTASRYGTDHHEIVVRDRDVSGIEDLVAHFDEPFGDASMLPTHAIAREARQFVKVCLSGDAGDEIFAGYSQYRGARAYARLDRVPLGLRRATFGLLGARLPDHVPGKGLALRIASTPAVRHQRQVGIFDADERRRLLRPELTHHVAAEPALFTPYFERRDLDAVSVRQLVDQNTYLPEDVLVKVDRAAMRHALEVRIPFLDHRVVALVNSAPSALKLRNGTSKLLLRRVVADRLPPQVLAAPKRGFGLPVKQWFRGELAGMAREILLGPSSRSARFVRPEAVARLLDAHGRGGRDLGERIWSLFVLEHWARHASL